MMAAIIDTAILKINNIISEPKGKSSGILLLKI